MASFQVNGLPAELFSDWFDLSDEALARRGARRMVVTEKPGFPCRVSLADAEVGETVLLVPFVHHDVPSPYRAAGPIFVRQGVDRARPGRDDVPEMLRRRLLSVRAYDAAAMMVSADVVEGVDLAQEMSRLFEVGTVAYVHVHNARPGCFNCRVDRAAAGGPAR